MSEPKRFTVTDEASRLAALAAIEDDGAIILTNLQPNVHANSVDHHAENKKVSKSWKEIAQEVPVSLFGSHHLLLQQHEAAPVHVEHAQMDLDGAALPPHTDGYLWGDRYPDLVILVCEQPATANTGGANFLLDGPAVAQRLSPDTRRILETVAVDHTERDKTTREALGVVSVNPVLRMQDLSDTDCWKKKTSRFCWRRMVESKVGAETSLWEAVEPDEEANGGSHVDVDLSTDVLNQALCEMDDAIREEAAVASRFRLNKGEGLVVDNFRMLHARESFSTMSLSDTTTLQRRMWRVWCWSDASMGLPPEMMMMDTTTTKTPVAANVKEAIAFIKTSAGNG